MEEQQPSTLKSLLITYVTHFVYHTPLAALKSRGITSTGTTHLPTDGVQSMTWTTLGNSWSPIDDTVLDHVGIIHFPSTSASSNDMIATPSTTTITLQLTWGIMYCHADGICLWPL